MAGHKPFKITVFESHRCRGISKSHQSFVLKAFDIGQGIFHGAQVLFRGLSVGAGK